MLLGGRIAAADVAEVISARAGADYCNEAGADSLFRRDDFSAGRSSAVGGFLIHFAPRNSGLSKSEM